MRVQPAKVRCEPESDVARRTFDVTAESGRDPLTSAIGRVAEIRPGNCPSWVPTVGGIVRLATDLVQLRSGWVNPCHASRLLVGHVDHTDVDVDAAGKRADRCEQGKWRRQLPGEVVDAEMRAVSAQFVGSHGQVDRLQRSVGARGGL